MKDIIPPTPQADLDQNPNISGELPCIEQYGGQEEIRTVSKES